MDHKFAPRALPLPLAVALIFTLLVAAALRLWQLHLLPPGLYFDEAFNGLDANALLAGARVPVFYTSNGGREPLFIDLSALAIGAMGRTPMALRLVSASTGSLTIALLLPIGRWMLADGGRKDEAGARTTIAWAALIAATGLAVLYWHVSLSRLGFRAVLLPATSALAIGYFWCAWKDARRRDFAWAGVWLAVTLYTYLAARLLPLVIVTFVGVELLVDVYGAWRRGQRFWPRWRERLAGLGILVLVALLLAAPLLLTLLRDPALLLTRVGDTSLFAAPREGVTLLQAGAANGWAFVRSLYVQGDDNLRHNLPGRPVNDWLQAALLSAGLLTAAVQIRRPYARLLLIWLGVMALPAVLSTQPVHSLRAAGVLPPLALLYGLGALGVADLPGARMRRPERQARRAPRMLAVIWAALLLFSGWQTATAYFQRWARDPALGGYFQVDQQLAASRAKALLADFDAPPMLISRHLFLQAQMGFALGPVHLTNVLPTVLSPTSAHPGALPVLVEADHDAGEPLFVVWRENGSVMAAQVEAPVEVNGGAALLFPPDGVLRWPDSVAAWPAVQTGSLAQGATLALRNARYPLDVHFANGVRLAGYDVAPDAADPQTADSAVRLHLFYSYAAESATSPGTLRAPFSTFDVFAHLRQGEGVVQTANGPLIGEHLPQWLLPDPAAEGPLLFEDIRGFKLPADMPPGKAFFETGLYTYTPAQTNTTFERIAILDGKGEPAADAVTLGGVFVGSPPEGALAPLPPLGAQYGGVLELTGLCVAHNLDGAQGSVRLEWRALNRPSTDYTAFVHLVDARGTIVNQYDAPLGAPGNPAHLWASGESARADFPLASPQEVPQGGRLRVGLYESVSGERLPISAPGQSSGAPGDAFVELPVDAPTCP